jgi:hypothetical protein
MAAVAALFRAQGFLDNQIVERDGGVTRKFAITNDVVEIEAIA